MRLLIFVFLVASFQASGQVVLKVDDKPQVTISTEDFGKLPRQTAVLHDHGKDVRYEGVAMHDLLARGGVEFGEKGLHGKQLSSYVAARASDGYEAVFALADFDSTLAETHIIIADRRDGKPLAKNEGPLRVVVPQDKRPARSVRLLRELDVVQLKK